MTRLWNELKNLFMGVGILGAITLIGSTILYVLHAYPWVLLSIVLLMFAWAVGVMTREPWR